MKRQWFVLFIIVCLAGCRYQSPASVVIENVGENAANIDPSWPTLESNRAAIVLVAYGVVRINGMLEHDYYGGLVVDKQHIISKAPPTYPVVLVKEIIVFPSFKGYGVPASIVAQMDRGLRSERVVILTTNDNMPYVRPAVFGGKVPSAGYYLDGAGVEDQANVIPVLATLSLNTQDCDVVGRFPPHYYYYINNIVFDMKHRLLCYDEVPSQELGGFLLESGVWVDTK